VPWCRRQSRLAAGAQAVPIASGRFTFDTLLPRRLRPCQSTMSGTIDTDGGDVENDR
jgi:hypothetical protein